MSKGSLLASVGLIFCVLTLVVCVIGCVPNKTKEINSNEYSITTMRNSFYELDENGNVSLVNSLPYQHEGVYYFNRTIVPSKTALIIMDAWIDMPSEQLNEYFGKISEEKVMPLVEAAIKLGHPVIALTNDPKVINFNTRIYPGLEALAEENKIAVLYHSDFNDDSFASYLIGMGINSLIYIGFASNICLIGRADGMISMSQHGFKLYFIPEASAAVEFADTWDEGTVNKGMTVIISQWLAEIINYDDFMEVKVDN